MEQSFGDTSASEENFKKTDESTAPEGGPAENASKPICKSTDEENSICAEKSLLKNEFKNLDVDSVVYDSRTRSQNSSSPGKATYQCVVPVEEESRKSLNMIISKMSSDFEKGKDHANVDDKEKRETVKMPSQSEKEKGQKGLKGKSESRVKDKDDAVSANFSSRKKNSVNVEITASATENTEKKKTEVCDDSKDKEQVNQKPTSSVASVKSKDDEVNLKCKALKDGTSKLKNPAKFQECSATDTALASVIEGEPKEIVSKNTSETGECSEYNSGDLIDNTASKDVSTATKSNEKPVSDGGMSDESQRNADKILSKMSQVSRLLFFPSYVQGYL